jgi:hypothetical protein
MQIRLEAWGMDLRVGAGVARLVAGDILLRVPRVGQIAWNHTGIYAERLRKGSTLDPIA